MPSKGMRSKTPTVSGGGGGTPTVNTPSARWSDDADCADALGPLLVSNPEAATVDDVLAMLLVTNPEAATAGEEWNVPLMQAAWAEDASTNDLTKVRLVTVNVARSGTPDTDPLFDAYGDQVLNTTNFGNANLQVKKSAAVGSNSKIGWLVIDLTNYSGWTASGTGLALTFRASTSLLVGNTTLAWSSQRVATKPFTESTVTYAAPPTAGTAVQSGTVDVANAAADFTITITAANLGACLGQWLIFIFQVTAVADLGVDTITIVSRDQAANRPTYSIDLIQRGT